MDLTGTDLDVAVNALIGSMLQNGYLSDIQNAILVSVENQDAAKSAQLQQHLTDTINSVFQGGSLEGAVLRPDSDGERGSECSGPAVRHLRRQGIPDPGGDRSGQHADLCVPGTPVGE